MYALPVVYILRYVLTDHLRVCELRRCMICVVPSVHSLYVNPELHRVVTAAVAHRYEGLFYAPPS